eukprot:TRINITY_DN380_c0_g1_i12.p1 TRINITY_DN380_c0_g1~~TRINITY_DN380_c0_g1_i12.p1  ORF type:complete len:544 (+),score=46.56 TRINITY_DN380_c0_g1_i12:147-1634(+)
MEDAVQYLVQYKLTKMAYAQRKRLTEAVLNGTQPYIQTWIPPSGPRRPGEGLDDCEQGILDAELHNEGVIITFTQLLAGFLIGPNGTSIRDLMRCIGCSVKSYTEDIVMQKRIRVRVFIIQGEEEQVLTCVDVLLAAVDRYKELAEGRYQGKYVHRIQKIKGYVFYYYPPPRNVVPTAAAIRGLPPSKQSKVAKSILGFQSTGSYLAYLDGICHQIGQPHNKQGLTDIIRESFEVPSEDVDDVGCQHSGLFPGRVYDHLDSINTNRPDINTYSSGLARAVHLKESLEISASLQITSSNTTSRSHANSRAALGVDAARRMQFDSVPPEIIQHAENLISENPDLFAGYAQLDPVSQKNMVVDGILEYFGASAITPRPTRPSHYTGVFINYSFQGDRVICAPADKRVGQSSSKNERCAEVSLPLRSPTKSPSKSPQKWEKPNQSPFRRTPFAERKKAMQNQNFGVIGNSQVDNCFVPNYFDQGLLLDLQKIIGNVRED